VLLDIYLSLFLVLFPAMLLQHMLCKLIGKKSWLEISQENLDENYGAGIE